jgi:hypothetical protein
MLFTCRLLLVLADCTAFGYTTAPGVTFELNPQDAYLVDP